MTSSAPHHIAVQQALIREIKSSGKINDPAIRAKLDANYREIHSRLAFQDPEISNEDRACLKDYLQGIRDLRDLGYSFAEFHIQYPSRIFVPLYDDLLPLLAHQSFARFVARVFAHWYTEIPEYRTAPLAPELSAETTCTRLRHLLSHLHAAGINPIEATFELRSGYGARMDHEARCLHELWTPYVPDLNPEWARTAMAASQYCRVYFGAYHPEPEKLLNAKSRRPFPRFARLPALRLPKGHPDELTTEDLRAFASWEQDGGNFDSIFSAFGVDLDAVRQASPAWDWAPRKVVLPRVTLVVDQFGIRHGSQRIAWRLGPNQLFCYTAPNTAAGRALLGLLTGQVESFVLSRQEYSGEHAFRGDPGEGDRNLLLHYLEHYPFSADFRWGVAGRLLNFLQPLKDQTYYRVLRACILPVVNLSEWHYRRGTNKSLNAVVGEWGPLDSMVRLMVDHFDVPHPEITAKIS